MVPPEISEGTGAYPASPVDMPMFVNMIIASL